LVHYPGQLVPRLPWAEIFCPFGLGVLLAALEEEAEGALRFPETHTAWHRPIDTASVAPTSTAYQSGLLPAWDSIKRAMAQTEFGGVTAIAKANIYFDGKVVSHSIVFPDGGRKTLGLIYPGAFHFGTGAAERMEIIAGSCRVKLDGTAAWNTYQGGQAFEVPAKSGFDIEVASGICEYICSFLG
jgi:purine/pyrimidine-nucleoside phosphorylase